MRIVVSGSTGMLGSAVVDALRAEGHDVVRLVRRRADRPDEISWQPGEGRLDAARLDGIEAAVHLSGEDVAQRWTDAARSRIRESRVRTTEVLSRALATAKPRPRVLISAGGIGYYGDRGDEVLDESSGSGDDFLARLGREWEEATQAATRAGIRVVNMRMAPVLTRRGGMLGRLLPVFRLGAGGKIGSGNQWLSWIALEDFVRVVFFLLEHEELRGPVNVASPNPVSNAEFTRRLGEALGRPAFATVPAFVLKLVYGEMAESTILVSQRVSPAKLLAAGFEFRHPHIREALEVAVRDS